MANDGVDIAVERLIDIPSQGTVVVGSIISGTVTVGQVLEFRGVRARCGAIEHFRTLLRSAGPGDRVGLLLRGAHYDSDTPD
jgi:translation elongation factor EF-Tu-like GTPase